MTTLNQYNPDVLSCLANLSSDEVFTPPNLANEILDLLPPDIWSRKDVTFFDPVSKSGIFLREIAKRLITGLETDIPNLQERLDHIFGKQLFGIAITELTALLSRRSVYCSKTANGKYSISQFSDSDGNIIFERIDHKWANEKCFFCGASKAEYARSGELETHAYQFIHTETPEKIFNMKFDVIIGNPPYQLNDGGGSGSSAKPIYNHFVTQAMKLNPRFLAMIIPSRWYSGGKGLDTFREQMLNDPQIRHLVDYSDSGDCFPGVDIAGGICYFLWQRDSSGACTVVNIHNGETTVSERKLNEFGTFIRNSAALEIVKKAKKLKEASLAGVVSSRKPFGLDSKVRPTSKGDLTLVWSGGEGKFPTTSVPGGIELIPKWKVLLSKASHDHGGQPDKEGKRRIFSRIEILPPGTICTESYLIAGAYDTEQEAKYMVSYLKTKFCRFLVSTVLLTQNIAKDKFQFVPSLEMNRDWCDEDLYERYKLSATDIAYIDSVIRPM